jgi:AraC family transcriptional regulator
MNVELKTIPELRVGAIHHTGPYDQIAAAFAQLAPIVERAGLFKSPVTMVGLYYNDPNDTPPEKLQSDAGILLAQNVALPPGLTEKVIPPGMYATTVHAGPYTGLPDAWRQLMSEWLPASGYRTKPGMSYELYLNDKMDVPPEELRTELRISVEPK